MRDLEVPHPNPPVDQVETHHMVNERFGFVMTTRYVETLLEQLLRNLHCRGLIKALIKEEKRTRALETVARHAQLL